MILLDTNVVSEMMRPFPDPGVTLWLDAFPSSEVWVSAITKAEIYLGIAVLPDGKRRERLFILAELMFSEDFKGQCLPFDCESSPVYGRMIAERNRQGRPISVEDAQIAAIAVTGRLTLATRNEKDFTGIQELDIVNPWDQA